MGGMWGSTRAPSLSPQASLRPQAAQTRLVSRLVELLCQVAWAAVKKQRREAGKRDVGPVAALASYVPQVSVGRLSPFFLIHYLGASHPWCIHKARAACCGHMALAE